MRIAKLAAIILIAVAASAAAKSPVTWPLHYRQQSANEFIWDSKTPRLVAATVPRKMVDDVLTGLGGPPDPVYVKGNRYFSTSACVAHACMSKSFYWLDTARGVALAALLLDAGDDGVSTLDLGSRTLSSRGIPVEAKVALMAWLGEEAVKPGRVSFMDASGRRTLLNAAAFMHPETFTPSADGPSFDCRRAATPVEKSICATPKLALLDLKLATLVAEIRHGHAYLPDREQLLLFQRRWLKSRDDDCGARSDIAACLKSSYENQFDQLMHWKPDR